MVYFRICRPKLTRRRECHFFSNYTRPPLSGLCCVIAGVKAAQAGVRTVRRMKFTRPENASDCLQGNCPVCFHTVSRSLYTALDNEVQYNFSSVYVANSVQVASVLHGSIMQYLAVGRWIKWEIVFGFAVPMTG